VRFPTWGGHCVLPRQGRNRPLVLLTRFPAAKSGLRISQKELFNILSFTPAITGIMNLSDRSLSLFPELLYQGIKTLQLRLKLMALFGAKETEFGEKENDCRLEIEGEALFLM
jgi:hypothetical protein